MDRVVGNTLGRPTTLQDRDISTGYPAISETPTTPPWDSSANTAEILAIQGYKMRRMQSEVIDVMYQNSITLTDDFVPTLQQKLDNWLVEAPDPSNEWILHSYHNLIITIYRPSKVNHTPSDDDLARCFTSSSAVVELYFKMNQTNAIDCTWMAIHWLVSSLHLCIIQSVRIRCYHIGVYTMYLKLPRYIALSKLAPLEYLYLQF